MGLPEGIGVIDGKHIVMEQPFNSGSHYRNYKGTDSIILLAMIGPGYGKVWSKCAFKNALEKNILNVSTPTVIPGRNVPVLYVCTDDDIFPLSTYMMKPYPQSSQKRNFQSQAVKDETHTRKRLLNTGK